MISRPRCMKTGRSQTARRPASQNVRRAHLFPGSDPRSFARPGLRLFPGVVYKRQTDGGYGLMMRYPEWASGRVPPGGIVVIIVVVVILRGVERKERKVIPICGSSAHNRRDRLGSRKRGVLLKSIYNDKWQTCAGAS